MPIPKWLPAVAALALLAAPWQQAAAQKCRLQNFTDRARSNGWAVQELNYAQRDNFLNHLNHDDGVSTNFYPPHLWETVRRTRQAVQIRIVYLDADNCVLGNSGEVAPDELPQLLAPNIGF